MRRARSTLRVPLILAGLFAAGCETPGASRVPTEADRVRMLELMLPQKIKIWSFTKVASFNDDDVPDGILVIVRPLDPFEDPVKAVGVWHFELYSFQDASGERKGERLAFWERVIATPEEVRLYWTPAQMYEFQLAWAEGVEGVAPGRKYVLAVTYRNPWEEILQDEYVIEFRLPGAALTEAQPR